MSLYVPGLVVTKNLRFKIWVVQTLQSIADDYYLQFFLLNNVPHFFSVPANTERNGEKRKGSLFLAVKQSENVCLTLI